MQERLNPAGFYRRAPARAMHGCPRCGVYAPWGRLCRDCQISQVDYAGYKFARKGPELQEETRF